MTRGVAEMRFGENLLWRVAVAVVFVPLFLWVSYEGGTYFFLYVELLIFLAVREYAAMMASGGHRVDYELAMIFSIGCGALFFLCPGDIGRWVMPFVFVMVFAFLVRWLMADPEDSSLEGVGLSIFGVLYIGFLASHQVLLRESPAFLGEDDIVGWYYVLFPYLLVWSSDTSAYFIGKFFGKHRLAPRTSPGKSVEGAIAGFVFCVVTAAVFQSFVPEYLSRKDALILGILIAIISQMGDIIESRIKREIGVKDASSFIPGHGGILDRYDGILVAVPVAYYYLIWGSSMPPAG